MDIQKTRNNFLEKERCKHFERKNISREIIQKLTNLESVWQKYKLSRIYLYGSFADTTFHASSDIDIAYEPELSWKNLSELYADVDKHFKQEIDIRWLEDLPFAKKNSWDGILIYDRENYNSNQRNQRRLHED